MRVTFTGPDNTRRITSQDLAKVGIEWSDGDNDLVWTPGSTIEVSEPVGQFLIKSMPRHFKDGGAGETRTREELYARATDLGIVGRSDMNKDELLVAVSEAEAREAEAERLMAGTGSTSAGVDPDDDPGLEDD